MKQFIKKILAHLFLKQLLSLHTRLGQIISNLAVVLNNGIHPKHRLTKYKEWFVDQLSESDVVLEVGSHCGVMTEILAEKAAYVYGVEIEKKYYDQALKREAKQNVQYINGDACMLDYSSLKVIDTITLSNVLEHIEDRAGFLNMIRHKVKWNPNKDKKILVRVPMIDRDWIVLYKKELGLEYRLDPTHYTEYTMESFMKEMDNASFSVERVFVRFGEIYAVCMIKA